MNCPRCGAANFEAVCEGCVLMTPAAIAEVQKILDQVKTELQLALAQRQAHHDLALRGFPEMFRQVAERRGVLKPKDIENLLTPIAQKELHRAVGDVLAEPAAAIAQARVRGVRRAAAVPPPIAPAPAPGSSSQTIDTTGAEEFHRAALRLKRGELKLAIPFFLLTLALVPLAFVGPPSQLLLLFGPAAGAIWITRIAVAWLRLRNTDPVELWRSECGGVHLNVSSGEDRPSRAPTAAATPPPQRGADAPPNGSASSTTITRVDTIRWTPDDLARLRTERRFAVGEILFGWFRIEAIRSGGFGVVYLCRHIATGEGHAIKTVLLDPLSDPEARASMMREAEVWMSLDPHPNVVSCDFLQTSPFDKRLWLGLERIDGDGSRGNTLFEWTRAHRLETGEVVRIVGGVCEAMVHVGAAGLVHGDLKPANVLVTQRGFAKVSDFGLTRAVTEAVTGSPMTVVGTPAYLAPECWLPSSPSRPSRDVYALGVMLWEMLTGRHPFAGNGAQLWMAHRSSEPTDPRAIDSRVDPALADIALRCLAKDPESRPTFAAVLARIRERFPGAALAEPAPLPAIGVECNRIASLIDLRRFDAAERRLDVLLRRAADHALVHAERAKLLTALGRPDEARASLEHVARVESTSVGVLLMKSSALHTLGRHEEALAAVDQALLLEPQNGWCLVGKGKLLAAMARYDDAEAVLQRGARLPTESGISALAVLADIATSRGERSQAIEYITTALRRNPNDEQVLCGAGRILYQLGRSDLAFECCQRVALLAPGSVEAERLKATILRDRGQIGKVEQLLRALADATPPDIRACSELGLLLNTRQPDEAREYFVKAAQAPCRTAGDFYLKAGFLGTIFGQWSEALKCAESAIALEPRLAIAWILKAQLHTYNDDIDAARDSFRRAQLYAPGDLDIGSKIDALESFARGQKCLAADPASALAAYNQALQSDPQNFRYLFAKATALLALKRYGQAICYFERGIEYVSRSASPWVRFMAIQCLTQLHLTAEAQTRARLLLPDATKATQREWLENLLNMAPPSISRGQIAAYWFAQGIEAQKANRSDDAVELLHRAVYANPSDSGMKGSLAMSVVILGCQTSNAALESEGLAMFDQALAIRRDPITLFNYAQAFHMTGRNGDAIRVTEELRRLTPDDPHLLALIADLNKPPPVSH